jgi:hypothetical protein
VTEFAWRPFLERWSRELIDAGEEPELAAEIRDSGWLGFRGATDEELAATEARLGASLPPSYRDFLRTSNGWRSTGTSIWRVWSADDVAWFRVRNRQWINAYARPLGPFTGLFRGRSIPDEDYFVYGDSQDSVHFRMEYLESALEISDVGDSAIYLLNPKVVTPDGEWEAWFFANWLPGAARYRSFLELMQAEYRSFRQLQEG